MLHVASHLAEADKGSQIHAVTLRQALAHYSYSVPVGPPIFYYFATLFSTGSTGSTVNGGHWQGHQIRKDLLPSCMSVLAAYEPSHYSGRGCVVAHAASEGAWPQTRISHTKESTSSHLSNAVTFFNRVTGSHSGPRRRGIHDCLPLLHTRVKYDSRPPEPRLFIMRHFSFVLLQDPLYHL